MVSRNVIPLSKNASSEERLVLRWGLAALVMVAPTHFIIDTEPLSHHRTELLHVAGSDVNVLNSLSVRYLAHGIVYRSFAYNFFLLE